MRRILQIALVLAAALPCASAWAQGVAYHTIHVHVQDDQGRPQVAQIRYADGSAGPWTDANGDYTDRYATAGETYYFSRHADASSDCAPPENPGGVGFTDDGTTSSYTVTLPSLRQTAWDPGISSDEQQAIDKWNSDRASRGLPPISVSAVLSAAVDWYAGWMDINHRGESSLCYLGDATARAAATGWVPTGITASIAFTGGSPNQAGIGGYYDPGTLYVGIAHVGDYWVVDVDKGNGCGTTAGCTSTNAPSSGATAPNPTGGGQTTPPTTTPPTDPGQTDPGGDPTPTQKAAAPRLSLRLARHGRKLVAVARLGNLRASGRLYIVLRHNGRQRSYHTTGDKSLTVRLRLARGTWKVAAAFLGDPGYRNANTTVRTFRIR
jgi:hypothetical protein